jgi:RNA recognition motif-containing protein
MEIYVGNLPYGATEDDLREAFSAFGEVSSVSIIRDKFSGDSKGFGFVSMTDSEAGKRAIADLNGKEFKGRTLKVNEAHSREQRGMGNGGGAGRQGGYRGGNGGGERGGFRREGGSNNNNRNGGFRF